MLDHDDLLSLDALAWVAYTIVSNRNIKLIYSDEDKIDSDGIRFNPYFKCDWNPILLEGQNVFSHLGVYSTELIKTVGGFRRGFEGSQDHDLILRCSELVDRTQIIHIPRILYHWRYHPGSSSSGTKAKPYTVVAAEKAICEHLKRTHLKVESTNWGPIIGHQIYLTVEDPQPKVSIIIPTRDRIDVLKPCILSLLNKTSYTNFEVIVIDNGSTDLRAIAFLKSLSSDGLITLLYDDSPFNYSYLNNVAVQSASGHYLCLLNNDIEITSPDWLYELVAQAQRPYAGAIGPKLLYPDHTIQHGGIILGLDGVANSFHHRVLHDDPGYFSRLQLTQEISAVTGACLLVRKDLYTDMNGLDEINLKVAYNDIDFCLRLKEKGYNNIFAPRSILIHHESVSRGNDYNKKIISRRFRTEIDYMLSRWGKYIKNDPMYNPNLGLHINLDRLSYRPNLKDGSIAFTSFPN